MFAALYCVIYFVCQRFHKSLKFFGTSIASLNPETGECNFSRSAWPAREAKHHSGAMLKCSAHDCETCLLILG